MRIRADVDHMVAAVALNTHDSGEEAVGDRRARRRVAPKQTPARPGRPPAAIEATGTSASRPMSSDADHEMREGDQPESSERSRSAPGDGRREALPREVFIHRRNRVERRRREPDARTPTARDRSTVREPQDRATRPASSRQPPDETSHHLQSMYSWMLTHRF